ncbi:hypothetical protein BN940_14436 [Castellaniella defragrans 65Phen]|uniref:Uncharacterized protein n=1 Tax=Castellaniella defragrans (strain DSM 12143 / CCUG 39792 / 65Phen) TaxID=1437824 RepID=W8X557_CASD6|nr:hypothetical protein BN940_14436 [Castellaniella defragrans 65Phen]
MKTGFTLVQARRQQGDTTLRVRVRGIRPSPAAGPDDGPRRPGRRRARVATRSGGDGIRR